ncbi:MAG: YggS family pyridoxal phosphate-dependent enzyme [Candidatus Omnitrophica bacterium CG11_big_fil_rev_8_21_14_0_20_43_6]|nr:MAG: YggS family pyridoxal phosphate-dependent enzyme [Candidatus Omnitrophica bacterium CG11_big_fil_rev_8_21_14_0_20_43_6]
MIKANIEKVRRRISDVCARHKIEAGKITLLCVTKGRSAAEIQEVVSLGINHLGENRVQEALEKYALIPAVQWQMVGHLQSNKVKDALKIFDLIHSVDRISLAKEINQEAVKINKIQDILLEVKTSPELRKFGFKPLELAGAVEEITKLENVKIKGLMTIAPLLDDVNETRPYFSKLRQLRDQLNSGWLLSMGMSDDFEVAIGEGADIIRIGRAIFQNNV